MRHREVLFVVTINAMNGRKTHVRISWRIAKNGLIQVRFSMRDMMRFLFLGKKYGLID
mgnify:FL=1